MVFITTDNEQLIFIPKFVESDSNSHNLTIINKLNNLELKLDVEDVDNKQNFYTFRFDPSLIAEGEYEYDVDGVSSGLLIKRTTPFNYIPDSCTNYNPFDDDENINTEYTLD